MASPGQFDRVAQLAVAATSKEDNYGFGQTRASGREKNPVIKSRAYEGVLSFRSDSLEIRLT